LTNFDQTYRAFVKVPFQNAFFMTDQTRGEVSTLVSMD